jgi:hypothetical protein
MRSLQRVILLGVFAALPGFLRGAPDVATDSGSRQTAIPGGYEGREPDAPWRAAAKTAIDRYRRATITVVVRDDAGFPVPDADVEFVETRPVFAFGATVTAARLAGNTGGDARYQGVVTNGFDTVVLSDGFEWDQPGSDAGSATTAARWLRDHHVALRGHSLVGTATSGTARLPADVRGMMSDPDKLRARIEAHVDRLATRFAGLVADWDVLDQPVHDTAIESALGRQAIADWFPRVHAVDPRARLYLSETGILEAGDGSDAGRLNSLAADLRSRGAIIDGLAIGARFDSQPTAPAELNRRLDAVAGTSPAGGAFSVRVTGFEFPADDETLQADYTRDFLTVAFAHPAVNGVLAGNFWEGEHARPKAAMFRTDWQPKPAALVWSNLTQREWVTRTNTRSSVAGTATIRGFKGDYRIRVHADGATAEIEATVLADSRLTAILGASAPDITVVTGTDSHRFSWPGRSRGFVLESAESLAPADWQSTELIPILRKGRWETDVPLSDSTRYYRLNRTNLPR